MYVNGQSFIRYNDFHLPLGLRSARLNKMSWRTQEAYDRYNEEQRRALPWHKRYRWSGFLPFILALALASAYLRRKLN
jgi:hypothetical protein